MKRNKTVLITGSTSGIGRKIVEIFGINKWNLICHYNSVNKNYEDLKKFLEEKGYWHDFIKADFSSIIGINDFINRLKEYNIDSLINNAGTYWKNISLSDINFDDMNNVFMVNFFAPSLISTKIFKLMTEKEYGRIVNISSIAAKYGSNNLPYGCSKLALEGITKTLARNGSKHNVLVNTIRPGFIDTDFHKKFPKDMKKRISIIPLNKIGKPEDIAKIVYLLGSDENSFITNEITTIAGGE